VTAADNESGCRRIVVTPDERENVDRRNATAATKFEATQVASLD